MSKIFFISSILLLFASCEQLVKVGDINSSQKYPAKVGHEWEYNTIWEIEFYDSTGHIDSTSFEDLGNTIVKVTKEQEVVGTYTNLIRFEDYDVATPQNIHKMWYMNIDSGFYAVAYYNPGASQPILPKQSYSSFEQLKNLIKLIGVFPGSFDINYPSNQPTDTIQYYSPIRKVLTYPLNIGSRWIELTQPFCRERFIQKQQIINTNGRNYNCYKIESNMDWQNLEYNDYTDLNSGLIKREFIVDSLMITTITNPDSGSYARSTSISKLVREKK